MPEKSPKAQPTKPDQKSAEVEHSVKKSSSDDSHASSEKNNKTNTKPTDISEPKTKSRLPNKSLTNAEVKNHKTKATEKSEVIAVKAKPKAKSHKASITPNTKPRKLAKSSTKKVTIKVIQAQDMPKAKSQPKANHDIKVQSHKSQKSATKPSTKPEIKSETRQPKAQGTNASRKSNTKVQGPAKTTKSKNFGFLSIFSQVIAGILGASSVFFIAMLIYLNILPTRYLLPAIAVILTITGSFGFLLYRKKPGATIKTPINILAIVFSCIYLIGGSYIAQTSGFLDSLKPQEYVSEQYYIIIKNDSNVQDIKELKDKTIGTFDEGIELYEEAIKKLNSTISVKLESVKSIHAMTEGLLSGEFDAALLSAVHKSIIDEDSAEFSENTKVLYTIDVKVKLKETEDRPEINVVSEPFVIYISGNDSYGDLAARGLSDVNMLAAVNPITHEILLVSIPRDCYVQLHGITGSKDKLTHAGLYGVQMSILTIEDLLNIDIDYYIKINFPALVNLVDIIGGIDVYSDKTFLPFNGDGRLIYEGVNHFDGSLALSFARERMAYTYGDRHRVQNQRDVLNAIIKKVSSSNVILTKTNEILSNLSRNLDTNISKSEISSLVKLQLQDMPSWQVGEYMINGSDLYTYTYTFGDQPRYVMPPYPESIQAAHDYITGILEGKPLSELNIPAPDKSWK